MPKSATVAASRAAARRAVAAFESPAAFAEAMPVSLVTVRSWLRGVRVMNPQNAIRLEEVTGGAIAKEQSRPDVFRAHVATRGEGT